MYGVISGLKNEKQGASMPIPTIKISPVKIPNGAVRIGNYILGKFWITQGKLLEAAPMAKFT